MAEKENKVAIYSDSQVVGMLATDEKGAVKAIAEMVNGLTSFDEKIDIIGKSALQGRAAWVQTAIIVESAFRGLSRKELGKKRVELQERLHYSRAHIFNFRTAGEKLIKGEFEKIPLSITDFVRKPKTEKPNIEKVRAIEKRGEYTTGDTIKWILFGEFALSNSKTENHYFTLAEKPAKRLIQNGKAVCDLYTDEYTDEKGITRTRYFGKASDGVAFEYDIEKVNL